MARAEDELRCALSVSIVGDLAHLSVDVLADELARRHELPMEDLEFHCLKQDVYLLVLPDEATTVRIYNEGWPLHLPPFFLCFRRWSRLKDASAVVLPSLVDVELSGVPAHAWELETAEHLLDEWCWVRELHPDTVNRRDYSFRLKAWCSQPELIPADMELVIVEPPLLSEEDPPRKRALKYDIKIASSLALSPGVDEAPPPPPPGNDSGHGRRRRRRRAPVPAESVALDPAGPEGAPRVSVHHRLGSGPVSQVHVAADAGLADGVHGSTSKSVHAASASSIPPSQQAAIDDMAATVIMPWFADGDTIPEMSDTSIWMSGGGRDPLALLPDSPTPAESVALDPCVPDAAIYEPMGSVSTHLPVVADAAAQPEPTTSPSVLSAQEVGGPAAQPVPAFSPARQIDDALGGSLEATHFLCIPASVPGNVFEAPRRGAAPDPLHNA